MRHRSVALRRRRLRARTAREGPRAGGRRRCARLAVGAAIEPVQQRRAVFAGQRPVGDSPRRRLEPGAEGRALLRRRLAARLAQQVIQRIGQRTARRPAPRWNAAAPWRRTSVSGSSPPGSAANCSVRSGASSGSASSARAGRRPAPAASPSKHRIGAGESRHSSSSCSSVSAVPSGATAPPNPACASAITSI